MDYIDWLLKETGTSTAGVALYLRPILNKQAKERSNKEVEKSKQRRSFQDQPSAPDLIDHKPGSSLLLRRPDVPV